MLLSKLGRGSPQGEHARIMIDDDGFAPQVLAIDIPSAGQAAVLVAVPVIGRAAPDWSALRQRLPAIDSSWPCDRPITRGDWPIALRIVRTSSRPSSELSKSTMTAFGVRERMHSSAAALS